MEDYIQELMDQGLAEDVIVAHLFNCEENFNNCDITSGQRCFTREEIQQKVKRKMTEGKVISWDEALAGSGFVKFEEDKRVRLAIKNWRIVEVEKQDYNDKTKTVIRPEFQADVVMYEGKQSDMKLGVMSKRFMTNVRKFVENKDPTKPVYISVKKIGKDQSTNYDIEDATPSFNSPE